MTYINETFHFRATLFFLRFSRKSTIQSDDGSKIISRDYFVDDSCEKKRLWRCFHCLLFLKQFFLWLAFNSWLIVQIKLLSRAVDKKSQLFQFAIFLQMPTNHRIAKISQRPMSERHQDRQLRTHRLIQILPIRQIRVAVILPYRTPHRHRPPHHPF